MSLVGYRSEPFSFQVEEAKVREFARAVLDPCAEASRPPVPPTFPMYGVADFERRFLFETLKLERTRTLNGGQEYVYARPLRIGDRLTCVAEVRQDYVKAGQRGGRMHFVVIEVEMRDSKGDLAVISRATVVELAAAGEAAAS